MPSPEAAYKHILMFPREDGELRCVTCRYGQQDKGPGEEWSYGSKKGRDGEKAKERDSMDYPAPVLACYPPGMHIDVYTDIDIPLFTYR